MIDWAAFTPWASLTGGVLIGIAVSALILLNGRIAGISGIIGGVFNASHDDMAWRVAFISGLLVSPLVFSMFAALPEVTVDASVPVLIVAGLLVGLGTRYGAGCTSGHGICGLSRLSPRSLVATLSFMAAGFLVVYIVRHVV